MATRSNVFNRQTRRAIAKAEQSLSRATILPAGVRSKIGRLAPGWLDHHAQLHGVNIGAAGRVTRKASLGELEDNGEGLE